MDLTLLSLSVKVFQFEFEFCLSVYLSVYLCVYPFSRSLAAGLPLAQRINISVMQ